MAAPADPGGVRHHEVQAPTLAVAGQRRKPAGRSVVPRFENGWVPFAATPQAPTERPAPGGPSGPPTHRFPERRRPAGNGPPGTTSATPPHADVSRPLLAARVSKATGSIAAATGRPGATCYDGSNLSAARMAKTTPTNAR